MARLGMRNPVVLSHCLVAAAAILAAPAAAHANDGFEGAVDLLEVHLGNGANHLVLDTTFTAGAGPNQLVVKVAGGSETRTSFDDLEIQALYSRRVSGTVAILGGVRHDFRAGEDLAHAALGIEMELTPWLAGEHYFYLSERGDMTGGAQLVARWELSSRLTVEPRLALGWAGRDIPGEALASGATDLEGSVRLRHAFGRKLDLYVGVTHERLLGGTREIAVDSGASARVTRAVLGAGLSF